MDSNIRRLRNDDGASRRKRKLTFLIIFFILLFAIIIGSVVAVIMVIEQEAESESAANPSDKIRTICDLTPFPTSCFHPIYILLQTNRATNDDSGEVMIEPTPSRIFTLSLRAASHELHRLISSNQMAISKVTKNSKILPALKSCDGLFRDSSRLLNRCMATMGVRPDDTIFKDAKIRSNLKEWITNTTKNMDKCLIGLKDGVEVYAMRIEVYNANEYLENSSEMLAKMDTILAKFNPQIIIINGVIDIFHDFIRL